MSKLSSETIEFSFKELLSLIEKEYNNVTKIHFRLYGGWYKELQLTHQASILQQLLYHVNVFPKIKGDKIIHGSITVVTSLYEIPEFTWAYTYKDTDGIKPVRINFDEVHDLCNVNRPNCPKFILNKFTKSKDKTCAVNGCNNVHKNVFKGIEQKMVDTLIACDIISITEDKNINGLVVISDDQDHFPAMALASKKRELIINQTFDGIMLLFRNEKKIEFITEFLKPFNIKIKQLS